MYKNSARQLSEDQKGFASIVIAMVLILVLSLITVGFAQLARREQQNALNKQLSSQAYYAAEAGVNDAYSISLKQNGLYDQEALDPSNRVIPNDKCLNNYMSGSLWKMPQADGTFKDVESTINLKLNTAYSCVTVDLAPTNMAYSAVGPQSHRSAVFSAVDLASGGQSDVKTLTVSWGSDDGHTGFPSGVSKKFKPASGAASAADNWGSSLGVIEVSVTPLGSNFNRTDIINNTFTTYLYPVLNGAGTVSYTSDSTAGGQVVEAKCKALTGTNSSDQCAADITNIPVATSYLVHFTNYYDVTNVNISAKNLNDKTVGTQGGQILIDSTGHARDVRKRLLIHVPIRDDGTLPDVAMEGQSICKRFETLPSASPDPQEPDTASGTYTGKACDYWSQ